MGVAYQLTFWGTRGSIPTPGAQTMRYGGNTACISLSAGDGRLTILDAGSGLRPLGTALMSHRGRTLSADILLSHTHWDHIQGLGFFAPVFVGGNEFTVWGPGGSPAVLESILEGQMDPNFSPLQTLKNFSAKFDVRAAACGPEFDADGVKVIAREHPHGATTALAFRLEEAGRVFVYASDVGYPESGPPPEAIALYRGAHVLLHDSTYRPEDQVTRRNRGFSSYEDACDAAIAAKVERLVTFHYDQDYTDDDVDVIIAECRRRLAPHKIEVVPAREGEEVEI